MPELPEVETIKNEIEPFVKGRTIKSVTLNWEGIVQRPSAAEFRSRLMGQKIKSLARHGKFLSFHFESGDVLIFHLRMSGSLLIKPDSPDAKYVRAVINLDDGTNIYFRDPRKFGRMWLVPDEKEIIGKLGPEPLEDGFTPEVLGNLLRQHNAPIKALLCDQFLIAGIGNMYADEALYAAKIHPMRSGSSLTTAEIKRLHTAIKQVLRQAIGNNGASIINYYRPDGRTGTAHFEFQVAHRRGENCPRCGTPLQRITVRGRGTYFCPKCQRL